MTVWGVVGGTVGAGLVVLRVLEKLEGEVILTIWVGRGTEGLWWGRGAREGGG